MASRTISHLLLTLPLHLVFPLQLHLINKGTIQLIFPTSQERHPVCWTKAYIDGIVTKFFTIYWSEHVNDSCTSYDFSINFRCFRERIIIGRFRNPATLVNGFRKSVRLRTLVTSKRNIFLATVKGWNTLTFVTNTSFLDVTGFLPYTKWTLPYL